MSFSSISEQGLADTISIGEFLIHHKASSFILEMSGNSMERAGILHGDQIIFERGRIPKFGDIVISLDEDGYRVRHLNDIEEDEKVIGVVVSTFRKYK